MDSYITGCLAISVKSETPLFSEICWWIWLPFYVLNGTGADLNGFEFLKFAFCSWSGPGTSSTWFSDSARFAASLSSSSLLVLNCLARKPLHKGKPDLKNHFWGQFYHVKWFSGQKVEHLQRTWTCCKPGWAWKPSWVCIWTWPWPKK